jgi:hypothetical protein
MQVPPERILIFSEAECELILDFCLKTFFRHYSLYEFSFKPKVDLMLTTELKNPPPEVTVESEGHSAE